MGDKRKLKVQQYKQRKAKETAAKASQKFINPRDVKGVRGFEERRGTLGEEFVRRTKTGGIVDKRDGGDAADEDQMLGRMRKVRERKADRYNLSDSATEGQGLGMLGNALGESVPKPLLEDDAPMDENRKKTKDEILQEIIEKNRTFREEKKLANEERDKEIKQLDADYKNISSLLTQRRTVKTAVPSSVSVSKTDDDGNAVKKSRIMVLGSDGSAKVTTGDGKPAPQSKEVKKEMEKILKQIQKENKAELEAQDVQEKEENLDEYDKLMLNLETSATAKAGSRTKSNAEVAAEAQAQLMRLQREKARRMKGDGDQSDDEEDGQGLYQPKFRTADSQETKDMKARKQASGLWEAYMQELEAECKPDEESGNINIDFERVDRVVGQLKTLADVSSMAAAHTAKGLVEVLNELLQTEVGGVEADESVLEVEAASTSAATPFALLLPSIFAKIFPPSDFKHPVCTPMALYLSSTLVRVPIRDLRDVAVGLFRAAILLDLSAETHRYSGEVIGYLTNVLSLTAVGAPRVSGKKRKSSEQDIGEDGRENPLLSGGVPNFTKALSILGAVSEATKTKKKSLTDAPLKFAAMFCTDDQKVKDTNATRHGLVCAAYKLALRATSVYGGGEWSEFLDPAFAPLEETLHNVEGADNWFQTSEVVKGLHNDLVAAVSSARTRSRDNRIPLRLQAHRPIPIPLYNCKVTEFEEGEEDEKRALKKEYKAEKKQVIRALRADTRYLMKAKEEEQKIDSEKRESTLKNLMTELQEQRKMIKDSDVAKSKLKSIQKKKAKS